MDTDTVGHRIRNRRQALGWTIERLAEEAKIKSKGFLSDLERGNRNVGADYLLDIARALGVSLDYLMKGTSKEDEAQNVEIPSSLSVLAKHAELTFAQTLMLLDARKQIVGHRSNSKSDDLELFDWKKFYEAMRPFLR